MTVRRIHLDTDLGGDPDDVCALALLLGSPDVELVGITTVLDRDGRRAGNVEYCLELAGREDVPVVAGSVASLTTLDIADPVIDDERYWPLGLPMRPASPGAALDALARSVESGAMIVAIGPVTNLALLEVARPGILHGAPVVVMGGWVDPPAIGLPQWGAEMDWNVQWDVRAMEIVATSGADLSFATLPGTLEAQLREAHLPRLRAAGALGELIANQSVAHAHDNGLGDLGRQHQGLPDDLLNMHWDPAACALALDWNCLSSEALRLRIVVEGGVLRFERDALGHPVRVLTGVDGPAFSQRWLGTVDSACSSPMERGV